MKQGCPATVVIAARRTSQQLEITKIDCNHNHEVNKKIFQLYPEKRRLTHDEKEYVLPLLDLDVLPKVIAGKLAEKTGKDMCFLPSFYDAFIALIFALPVLFL
ncbi:hypothetical protein HPB49_006234 [Dermacentor silvarum]|uniref:Uncharacterized protein n=1 Tax=Dermacentor silvarum TaxID=543639 RepID=A0ACB8CQA4_DERSI|nr:hypothetical protein HPB49_006234 [Dermacentor silvarum]